MIDGDTLHVALENDPGRRETVVRLIGIDAPEMNTDSMLPSEHWADRSRNYVIARTAGRPLVLRLEPTQTRDGVGRLLAYVYVADSDCLNADIVRDGQGYADRRFRHSFRAQFEAAENDARKKQRGLWKDLKDDQMPAWRRDWLRELYGSKR